MIESHPHVRMSATDRRHQLLDAALDVFSRKGFGGATTKEIAAAAGVTEAIIFRHFPNKQALYTAVLDYKTESCNLQECMAESQACMDRNDDAGLFRTIATRIIASYRTDSRLERVLLFAALEGHDLGLAHHRNTAIPLFELLRDYIARRQRDGALWHCGDPGIILAAIAGMAQHYAMKTEMFGFRVPNISDEDVIDTFVRIVLHGVQVSPLEQKETK